MRKWASASKEWDHLQEKLNAFQEDGWTVFAIMPSGVGVTIVVFKEEEAQENAQNES